MNPTFTQWLNTNKLPIVVGYGHNPYIPKYSILPLVHALIYEPSKCEVIYVYRMVTKEHYDELIKDDGLIYIEGRLLKI